MESITNLLSRAGNYLTTIGISDFIDILIVAFLIYRVIWFVKKSNFINLAKGLLLILLALWLSGEFGLIMINYILRRAVELGMIALVILFQPELRRLLERVGSDMGGEKLLPSQIAMVGDRLYTDIAAGNRAGFVSIFVLSGEASLEDAQRAVAEGNEEQIPDLVFPSVAEIPV